MTGAELIRRLRRLGHSNGIAVRFVAHRGKGSHGTIYYGDRRTIIKDRKKEIGPALLSAMLENLGLDQNDLRKGK